MPASSESRTSAAADTFDVVVVGGGLAGLSVAYELAKGGAHTLVVDRRDPGRATDAGAGILSPETTRSEDQPWVSLALAAGHWYPSLVAELGPDTGWERCGYLFVQQADWDRPYYEAALRLIRSRQPSVVEISADDARSRFPPLGEVAAALYFDGAARVDGRRLSAALASASVSLGVEIRHGVVRPGRPPIIDAGDAGSVTAGAVVVAGGAWSAAWAAALGVSVGVQPVRGQIVHVEVASHDTSAWPILQPVLGHYMVPFPGGRVAVGATFEPDAGFDPRPTVGGMRQLLSWSLRAAPGLADASFLEVRVGLRPVSFDDRPLLGRVADDVFVATGYGAEGLLLSPYCGHLVAASVLGSSPPVDLAPFRPDR